MGIRTSACLFIPFGANKVTTKLYVSDMDRLLGTDRISAYYDNNTWWFHKLGKAGKTGNIHACLRAPGVQNTEQASDYANLRILDEIREGGMTGGHLLDLGCGTGGTLAYLARQLQGDFHLTGVTVSPKQARIASTRIRRWASVQPVHLLDFHHLPQEWTSLYHFAWAIESFVHSTDPERFFSECYRILQPGGRLVIMDTFPAIPEEQPLSPGLQWLEDYMTHWHAGHRLSVSETEGKASDAGFSLLHQTDLTPWVEKGRPRDRWIAWVNHLGGSLAKRHTYLQSLKGGHAVQQGFLHGQLTYTVMVFQKLER